MEKLFLAISSFGGQTKFASCLGVAQNVLANWIARNSFPIERCVQIEQATKGAVMRWDLRPDDWHKIWPELRKRKDAPKEVVNG